MYVTVGTSTQLTADTADESKLGSERRCYWVSAVCVCVHVYVCVHAYAAHVYMHVYVCTLCTCEQTRVHAHVCTRMCAHTCAHACVRMCVRSAHACVHACTVCTCVHVCVCTCACEQACLHLHTAPRLSFWLPTEPADGSQLWLWLSEPVTLSLAGGREDNALQGRWHWPPEVQSAPSVSWAPGGHGLVVPRPLHQRRHSWDLNPATTGGATQGLTN